MLAETGHNAFDIPTLEHNKKPFNVTDVVWNEIYKYLACGFTAH